MASIEPFLAVGAKLDRWARDINYGVVLRRSPGVRPLRPADAVLVCEK